MSEPDEFRIECCTSNVDGLFTGSGTQCANFKAHSLKHIFHVIPLLVSGAVAIWGLVGCAHEPVAGLGRTRSTQSQITTIDLGGGVTMEFVLIPAGSFSMGSDEELGDGDESPKHKVILTKSFYLGRCEVTQAQWQRIMGSNPSQFKGVDRPVDTVSWDDCQVFLSKLQARTGHRFALPTEAQWEYASRAGNTNRWSFGDNPSAVGDYAWCDVNAGGATHPVGGKKPNVWGLYDMSGNVWEWCGDFYTKHAYDGGDAVDPLGPLTGTGRVLRGGAWGGDDDYLRCACRNCAGADAANNGTGLRCVMVVD